MVPKSGAAGPRRCAHHARLDIRHWPGRAQGLAGGLSLDLRRGITRRYPRLRLALVARSSIDSCAACRREAAGPITCTQLRAFGQPRLYSLMGLESAPARYAQRSHLENQGGAKPPWADGPESIP